MTLTIGGVGEVGATSIKSFFSREPQWDLLPFDHLSQLSVLQWKLHNLALFRVAKPEELAHQNQELESHLAAHLKN